MTIIVNYLYIFAFAMIGEILRAKYFLLSKVLRKPQMMIPGATTASPKLTKKVAAADDKKSEIAEVSSDK